MENHNPSIHELILLYIRRLNSLGYIIDDENLITRLEEIECDEERVKRIRKLLSCFNITSVHPDDQGKIITPAKLKELLGIKNRTTLHRRLNKYKGSLLYDAGKSGRMIRLLVNKNVIVNVLKFKRLYEENKTNIEEYLNSEDSE